MKKVKTILFALPVLLLVLPFVLFGQDAAPAAAPAASSTGFDWGSLLNAHTIATFFAGAIGLQLLKYLSSLLTGQTAADFVKAELEKLKAKIETNSVVAQFHAESALFQMAESAVPVVMAELSDDIQKDIAAGNINAVPIRDIASRVWDKIKTQAQGGWNDYLQHSAFEDGVSMCEMIVKKFVSAQALSKIGISVPGLIAAIAPPAPAAPAAAPAAPK